MSAAEILERLHRGEIKWHDVEPADAVNLVLPWELGPRNEVGGRCPWPWDPQQLGGAPLGQYHCGYCGGMQVAGLPHLDLSDDPEYDGEEGMCIAYTLMIFWQQSWV